MSVRASPLKEGGSRGLYGRCSLFRQTEQRNCTLEVTCEQPSIITEIIIKTIKLRLVSRPTKFGLLTSCCVLCGPMGETAPPKISFEIQILRAIVVAISLLQPESESEVRVKPVMHAATRRTAAVWIFQAN